MKIISRSFLMCFLASVFLFSACKKYEDGPLLSLRTKKNRISGVWSVSGATLNGADRTSDYRNLLYRWVIDANGTYTKTNLGGQYDDGPWKFEDKKNEVSFTTAHPSYYTKTYKILRLKHKDVWLRETQANGDVVELHLVQFGSI